MHLFNVRLIGVDVVSSVARSSSVPEERDHG